MSDLKNRLESILFAAGKAIKLEELSRLTKERDLDVVKKALDELRHELEQKQGSVMLMNDCDEWKLTVREKYLPFVRKIVTKTELPKSIIETLAIVAFKAPVLQSKVIQIRTNKAYQHLDFLEEKGYITREKKGRTKLIKLTQKFFEYFDVPPEKLKEKFKDFKELDTAIEQMEAPAEVDLLDEEGHKVKLEEYNAEPELEHYKETPSPVEEYAEKVGELETYGEKAAHHAKKHKKKEEKKQEKEQEKEKQRAEEEPEEEFEPPTEEELAEALGAGEAEEEEPEEETAGEEAKESEEKTEEIPEKTEESEEKIKEPEEETALAEEPKKEKKMQQKKHKKDKKKKEKEQKTQEEQKEEINDEEKPKEEERPKITEREVREQARKLAEESTKAPPKYETEGIFKGEIPQEIKEKIEKRAEEIVYGEKPELESEEKEEIGFEEKPELESEEKEKIKFDEKPELSKKEKKEIEQEEKKEITGYNKPETESEEKEKLPEPEEEE